MLVTILSVLFIVVLMVGLNGLYVAGEFAAVSARKTRIMQMADDGNSLARTLLPVLEDPQKLDNYIAASQVGITLSSLTLGIYGQQQLAPRLEPVLAAVGLSSGGADVAAAGVSATLVLIVLTTLQVVFGELVPKTVALRYPEQTALTTALPMKWSAEYILRPLIVLLNGSGALLLKLLGVSYGGGHAHVHSPEEIVILVKESHRGGLLDADDRQLLQNVFRISETRAIEISVPRTRIIALEIDTSLQEALHLAADSAFTRLPVYKQNIDDIVGFVHLRDLFNLYQQNPSGSLRDVLRPVPFVPETLTILDVWNRLNEKQSYLAIVFDEYGGTSGLITREDLIEEIFGELQDEFDQERALIRPMGEGRLVLRGDMAVSQLNNLLEINLPHETSHTIAGLVQDQLGRVPSVGDIVELDGVTLRVEAVANRSANSVSLTPVQDAPVVPPGGQNG